jgi:hypothetical protein
MTPPDTDIGVSAFSSPDDLKNAYNRIKDEIKGLKSAIKAWRHRHNTLNITARLPPEILLAIFSYVQVAVPTCHQMPWQHSRFAWIRQVAHVCSHWRSIALECPSLWTDIPFDSHPRLAKEMLKRCGTAPLDIVITITPRNWRLITSLTFNNFSRLRKLHIYETGGFELNEIVKQFVEPAPVLESLVLNLSRRLMGCYHTIYLTTSSRHRLLVYGKLNSVAFKRCLGTLQCGAHSRH